MNSRNLFPAPTTKTAPTAPAAKAEATVVVAPPLPQQQQIPPTAAPATAESGAGLRGVLKKEHSHDEPAHPKPILKNSGEESAATTPRTASLPQTPSPSSSSEDIDTAFNDVIIDPIPGACSSKSFSADELQHQPQTRGSYMRDREAVIPPSSVKISSDDRNLASKLADIALEAENIKRQRHQQQLLQQEQQRQQQQQQQPSSKTNDAAENKR